MLMNKCPLRSPNMHNRNCVGSHNTAKCWTYFIIGINQTDWVQINKWMTTTQVTYVEYTHKRKCIQMDITLVCLKHTLLIDIIMGGCIQIYSMLNHWVSFHTVTLKSLIIDFSSNVIFFQPSPLIKKRRKHTDGDSDVSKCFFQIILIEDNTKAHMSSITDPLLMINVVSAAAGSLSPLEGIIESRWGQAASLCWRLHCINLVLASQVVGHRWYS